MLATPQRTPAACLALLLTLATSPSHADAPPRASQHDADAWYRHGAERALALREGSSEAAKNLIVFIGDGMGVSTVTAARILAGQRAGGDGEDHRLAMEQLPHLALVKTYSVDGQTSDSAPTATALLSGAKTLRYMLGVGPETTRGGCGDDQTPLPSLFALAEQAGLATGIVSSARLTHATPAAAFAHASLRTWESDAGLDAAARAAGCVDIARQFLGFPWGDGFEVVLAGGREAFLPDDAADPEYPRLRGDRRDGRDLLAAWRQRHPQGRLVTDRDGYDALDPADDGPVLGLFEPSHMRFELDRADDPGGEPSLAEMTRFAIRRLARDGDGYVLLVEGGRIDHGHHHGNAARALEDTLAFDAAIAAALELVSLDDTLVLVTADHSHTLTIGGSADRGNPILGHARLGGRLQRDLRGQPYPTLGYANGPGWRRPGASEALPPTDPGFLQPAAVPLASETHAGEDVPAWAGGPGAAALRGTLEQHVLFHLMLQAMPALVERACLAGGCEQGRPLRRVRPGPLGESRQGARPTP